LLESTEGKGREDVPRQEKGDEMAAVQGFGSVNWLPCTTAVPFASAPSDPCHQMDLVLGGAPSHLFLGNWRFFRVHSQSACAGPFQHCSLKMIRMFSMQLAAF
jgi:hypothetical protein